MLQRLKLHCTRTTLYIKEQRYCRVLEVNHMILNILCHQLNTVKKSIIHSSVGIGKKKVCIREGDSEFDILIRFICETYTYLYFNIPRTDKITFICFPKT